MSNPINYSTKKTQSDIYMSRGIIKFNISGNKQNINNDINFSGAFSHPVLSNRSYFKEFPGAQLTNYRYSTSNLNYQVSENKIPH